MGTFGHTSTDGGGWKHFLDAEMERLKSLIPGPEGYGPVPPLPKIVSMVQQIAKDIAREDLPLPFVVPGTDGGVQIKWRKNTREFSVFVNPESIEFLTVEPAAVLEGDLKDPKQLNKFLDWLLEA